MCEFSAYVAFNKATNGQTDIKHEMGKTLSSVSLLKIVGEKLTPSQRSSLEIQRLVSKFRSLRGGNASAAISFFDFVVLPIYISVYLPTYHSPEIIVMVCWT